ncbi:MAG: phosphate-binding protein, partial [Thermoplasmata archaeon]|nr:phosphate-binding protein [Thermoplasmata archaeon]
GGPVTPSPDTIEDGSYSPLSRPLFIYADANGSLNMEEIKSFLRYGFSEEGQQKVADVGYVGLSPQAIQEQLDKIPA